MSNHGETPPRRQSSPPRFYMNSAPTTPINSPPRKFSSPDSARSRRSYGSSSIGGGGSASRPSSAGRSSNSSGISIVAQTSDRFIPSRLTTNLEDAFDMMENRDASKDQNLRNDVAHENQVLMNNLLRSELLGQSMLEYSLDSRMDGQIKSPSRKDMTASNLFKYRSRSYGASSTSGDSLLSRSSDFGSSSSAAAVAGGASAAVSAAAGATAGAAAFGGGGHSSSSRRSVLSPKKPVRKISMTPFKVLDAPALQDDYYLNLVDWSHNNILSVALGSSVYLWSACTSKVTRLCDFGSEDSVTSIAWATSGNQISVGTNSGKIQIWDASTCEMVRELTGHESRVGTMAWSSTLLASGSRDRNIYLQDVRIRSSGSSSSSSSSNFNSSSGNSSSSSSSQRGRHSTGSMQESQQRISTVQRIVRESIRSTSGGNSGSSRSSAAATTTNGTSHSDSDVFIDADQEDEEEEDMDDNDDDINDYDDAERTAVESVDFTAATADESDPSLDYMSAAADDYFSSANSAASRPTSRRASYSVGGYRTSSLSSGSTTAPAFSSATQSSSNNNIRSSSSSRSARTSIDSSSGIRPTSTAAVATAALHRPARGSSGSSSLFPSTTAGSADVFDMPYIGTTTGTFTAPSSYAATVSAASQSASVVRELSAHKQEVCGLKWSFDEKMLASGGNDNKLFVWEAQQGRSTEPLCRFEEHTAAVKAVAWSPHQHGLLASGGGTADRHIRFWNATTSVPLHKIDTGSQVCNLMWSKNVNEIVSTHGYSLNQVIVWKYPSMQKIATLTGHSLRVLYLAMSPDGQNIVTGAGDETLRFWNVFPGPRSKTGYRIGPSLLTPSGNDIR